MKDSKKKEAKKTKKKSAFGKALNKLMPYILTVIAAFVLFSLSGLAGDFGDTIRNGLYGAFSNFATYFLPIFLIYHAIMWNYDIKRGCCIRRLVCSVFTLMCFSTMQYLIQVGSYPELDSYTVSTFYDFGKAANGGGVVGGLLGKVLLNINNIVGVIIITLILVFMILQMFNITPAYMARSMFKGKKSQKKKAQALKANPKKKVKPTNPKKIEVFDDEDSLELDAPPEYLDETRVISVDEGDTGDDEEVLGYEDLDVNEINAKTEHIPSQLEPYVEDNSEEGGVFTAELTVSKSKYDLDEDDFDEDDFDEDDLDEDDLDDDGFDEDDFAESDDDSSKFDPIEDEEDEEPYVSEPVKKVEEKPNEENSYISQELLNKASAVQKKPFVVDSTPVCEKPKVEKMPKAEEKPKAPKPKINYMLPPLYFLKSQPDNSNSDDVRAELQENAKIIVDTLNDFKAPTRIVDVTRGPTITRYELQPEKGVRVRTIEGLVDDIALNLAAKGIRIECPIPGKNAIGIEVPNRTISFVYLRDLIEDPRFDRAKSKLTCALGKSIAGENIYVDIESTPHLLVAGATGMGKSVCINSLLVSLLYKAKPDEVRLILIDPKRVELSNYNGIPHLLVPVVCEPKKSLGALQWAVTEMEERFMSIEAAGVRNIQEFNDRVDKGYDAEKMARIVIVIDELADLKMAVPDIEGHITRLTQKARAAGIHIIIGTQRPSVDVLTGLIKNNIPSRIAFRVPSQVDSRTILDEVGAEKLVAKGDMLVKLTGALAPVRVQGAYVSVDEIQDVIDFWKESGPANYDEDVMQKIDNNAAKLAKNDKDVGEGEADGDGSDLDPEFYNALGLAVELGKISSSLLMRKLSLGFQRASRVIDQMEECGYIGEANGPKPRDVLISKEDYQELMMRRNDE